MAAGRGDMILLNRVLRRRFVNQLRRRFVNLVAENCTSRVCSLHRLDVSERLFYPSTAEAEAAKPTIYRLSLPPPTFNFQAAVAPAYVDQHIFGLANPRISDSRILWSSPEGNTAFLYDADSHTARSLPSGLRYKGTKPIVISAPVPFDIPPGKQEEDLFVMCSNSGYPSFQVLRFDHSKPKCFIDDFLRSRSRSWEWERLPPPPLSEGSAIYTHAVLDGGRVICVSALPSEFGGTYLFDTVRREWMQQATSDWQMPFFGAPQYVPDLDLWLGVQWSGDEEDDSDRHHLCASSDLGGAVDAAMRGADRPSVTVTRHWKEGLETPEGWETSEAQLLDLGGGRFCVAKIIDEAVIKYDTVCKVNYGAGDRAALLTGVEMVRGAGDGCSSSSEDGFRMVVHKSLSFIFCQERIKWVL